MDDAHTSNTTVLPPAMEASRLAIHKRWLCIILPATVPGCLLSLAFMKYSVKSGHNLIFSVLGELAVIYAFISITFRVVQYYIEYISRKQGYICPHCNKSLFRPTKKSFGAVEITGLCPSCKSPIVRSVDGAVVKKIEILRKKKFSTARKIQLVGISLALVSMAVRYSISNSSHEAHALKYLQEKNFDQAIAEANQELDAHPNNVAALADRGTAYLRKQMNDKALSDFGRAISLNPQNYLALAGKCEVDTQARAYNDAITECSRALSISSVGVIPYLYRADGYASEGRYELAEKDFQSAIQLMPNTALLYALQGGVYVQDGQLEKAREYFQKAGRIDSNAIGLFIGRGMLEVLLNDSADALRDLNQAVKQMPSDATSIIWLHNAKYHDGENDSVELERWRGNLTDAKWPSTAVDLYAGKTTVNAVRAQANADGVEAAAVQTCQAEYYIGEYYLQHGDRANAQTSLLSAVNSCPQKNSAEKQAASAEIKAAGR